MVASLPDKPGVLESSPNGGSTFFYRILIVSFTEFSYTIWWCDCLLFMKFDNLWSYFVNINWNANDSPFWLKYLQFNNAIVIFLYSVEKGELKSILHFLKIKECCNKIIKLTKKRSPDRHLGFGVGTPSHCRKVSQGKLEQNEEPW